MRIGINTLVAVPSQIGGAQTYLRKLIESVAKIDKLNQYFLFVAPWNKDLFCVRQKNFKQIMCSIPRRFLAIRVLYEQTMLPFLAWKNGIDVLHSPASVSPFVLPCPSVLTMHDVAPLVLPDLTPPIFRYYWNITFKVSARVAGPIITVSHSAKKDLVELLGIPEEKIEVIYHGSEPETPELKEESYLRLAQKEDKSNAPYILWVGRMYAHKNLLRLLYAYNKLITTYQGMKHQLVLCGMKAWGYPSFAKSVQDLSLQDKVVLKGYVSDDELKQMYSNSNLFVFPSLIEGFGFPILEAMSRGVPVITSNYGAMAEIAGDAALLVDPYDIDEIAEAMYKVLTDENLRKDLIKKGLERVSQFSWEKTARETLAVYKRLCTQK